MKGFIIKPGHASVLALIWMMLIFYLSNQPGFSSEPDTFSFFEVIPNLVTNLLHLPEYGVLAALYWFSLQGKFTSIVTRNGIVISSCLLFAILDEFHQSFIPGRYASMLDITSDFVGASIAVLLLSAFYSPNRALAAN